MFRFMRLDWKAREITIHDDEFIETIDVFWNPGLSDFDRCWNSIIDVYEKRNKVILPNLILMIKWYSNHYDKSINIIMGWIKTKGILSTSDEEVKKYLLLL